MKSETKPKKVNAIIWDMDGVLLDTENLHPIIESQTAKHFGVEISPEEITRRYLGVHLKTEFEDIFKRHGKQIPHEEVRKIRDRLLLKNLSKEIKLTPKVMEVLEKLSQEYKLAIVSNAERVIWQEHLKNLGLAKYFQLIILGDDVQNPKPHPEPFLKAAHELGIKPEDIIVIEDSVSGFTGAKAAGMKLIARKADHNKHLDFSQADFVITDLREIPGILDSKLL